MSITHDVVLKDEVEDRYIRNEYGFAHYLVRHVEALLATEPTELLTACEDAVIVNAASTDPSICTSIDCETVSCEKGLLWHVTIEYLYIPAGAILEDVTEYNPFDVTVNYELGSPGTATLTMYGDCTDLPDGLYKIYANGILLFTGYITDIESWTEIMHAEDGSQISFPITRASLVDATKILSESILVGPYFFPGDSNFTVPYNDGTDHFISVKDAAIACFGLAGVSADFKNLPTNYGFHSGANGERTWIVQSTSLDAVVNTIYELTGIHCWADRNGKILFGGGGGSPGNLPLYSHGRTDRYYRTGVKGYGNGIQVSVGKGPKWGYFIEESISDPDELEVACQYILNQCKKNHYLNTYKGNEIVNAMPGGNVISVNMRMTNQIIKPHYGRIVQDNWFKESTVVIGNP